MRARTASPMTNEPLDMSLFTKSRKADYWNDFYQNPASVFEHTMAQRRDYAHRYICGNFPKSARLLDLGCGAGVLSEQLLRSGYRVTCADASEDMLELARRRLSTCPSPPEAVVRADIRNLPFEDSTFDLVICMGVFGYFDEVEAALAQVRRVLVPGGVYIMSIRNPYNLYLCELGLLPWRLCRFVGKKISRGLSRAAKQGPASVSSWRLPPADAAAFRVAIHTDPRAVIAGIEQRGFKLIEFDGLGYGPPTVFGKEFLPATWSMKLSDGLADLFRRTGLHRRTRWFADVSFYTFCTGD